MDKPKKTKYQTEKKSIYIWIVLLLMILLLFAPQIQALSEITLVQQTNPLEYGEIQELIFNITTNTLILDAVIEFDQQNHTLQKQGDYYEYVWIPDTKGILAYTVYVSDENNNNTINTTINYTNSFLVQDTIPPIIIHTSPKGELDYSLIELRAITDEDSTCKYDEVDVSYDSMTFYLSGELTVHTKLRSFSDGNRLFFVKCKDEDNNIGSSEILSFSIDTTPPSISGISPSGTVTDSQKTVSLNTNENADCKWGKTNNEYENLLNHFSTTGGTRHEQPVSLSEGINTYYIACKDEIGNYGSSITLNIELKTA